LPQYRFLPFEAKGRERIQDPSGGAFDFARGVEVLKTQKPHTGVAASLEVARDGGKEGSEVQIAAG